MTVKLINGAYLADTARVMGEVELGEDVNVWYGVTIRGDLEKIIVGKGTNVQEHSLIHADPGYPITIGQRVTIGHGAMVHGSAVGDGSLIGIGAILLSKSKIGKGCIVAAGAVVPPNMDVPDHTVVMGIPGKIVRETTDEDKQMLERIPKDYIREAKLHAEQPDHPEVKPWGSDS